MRKKCSLWRNVSRDQLVRIFSTGLLKRVVEMCIFHSPSSLILAKEYFGVLGSVSERLSKRGKKKKEVSGCCLMLQLSQHSGWLSKSSSAACHRPWPCSRTLLSAMAAVLILQSAVSSLQRKTNSCWVPPPPSFFSWSHHALACLVLLHCLLNNSDISV